MKELFQGWQRKMGCVMLVLAAVLAGTWVRSLKTRDVYAWQFTESNVAIRSFEGGFGWQRSTPSENVSLTGWLTEYIPLFDPWNTFDAFTADRITLRWEWAGFSFGVASWPTPTIPPQTGTFVVCIIPYWSVTLPLTFVAAYLILSPRKKKNNSPRYAVDSVTQPPSAS